MSIGTTPDRPALQRSEAPTDFGRTKPAFSILVPCYNEELSIVDTVRRLRANLQFNEPYELIVVNDGSTDASAERLRELAAEDPDLVVVSHERNRGYGASLKTGIRQAASDLIVITDADGTYPIDRIGEMLSLADRHDMVVGSRNGDNVSYSWLRRIPKVFLRRYASWLAGRNIPDINSGFRVFRRDLAERFLHILPDGFSFTTTITLAMLTNRYRVYYLPISYSARVGRSKIQPVRDTLRFVQLIIRTGMYFAPLRVFSPIILLLSLAFAGSLVYDVLALGDLTDKTVILLMFAMNTTFFALLADMIDKRSGN